MTGPVRPKPAPGAVSTTTTSTTAASTTAASPFVVGDAAVGANMEARAAVGESSFEAAATPTPTPTRTPTPKTAIGTATVVGAGPAGLAQASLLLKRAKEIGLSELTVVELRGAYTRPVGLAFRQMNLDALAWLNPTAHKELVALSGLEQKPFIDGRDPNVDAGDAQRFQRERLDDTRASVAQHAQAMMSQKTMSIVTLRDVEDCYWKGLEQLARENGVTLRKLRERDVDVSKDEAGNVHVTTMLRDGKDKQTLPPQDLVLVAQGVNCAVRKKLNTPTAEAASPADRFIAAVMSEAPKTSGPAHTAYREDVVVDDKTGETQTVRLVRGVHARNGGHWCLAQVPDSVTFTESIDQIPQAERDRLRRIVEPKLKLSGRAAGVTDADLVAQKVAEEVEAYFRAQHAKTGASDLPLTYGPTLFSLQAKHFSTALLGNNCVSVGDAVGTSHFNVSGGAATGVTTHTLALDRYLTARAHGQANRDALVELDRDLQQATLVWQLFGITQFEGEPKELRDTFYPRDKLAKVLPADVLELYWPQDGSLPKSGPWHAWLAKPAAVAAPPPEVVRQLVDAAQENARVSPLACVNPNAFMFATE